MKTKVTIRRPAKSRKKWILISARFINGETRDLAQFTAIGDANLYLNRLANAPCSTAEEIFAD